MASKLNNMMMRHFYIIGLVLFIYSCSTRPNVPCTFPNEDKMALIIADVYQTESVLSQTRLSYNSSTEDKVSGYYRFVLEQHGLTKVEFDTAMGWYSAHPVVLSDVYEQAVEILSRRDAELKNKINKDKEEHSAVAKIPNRQELWKDTTAFQLPTNPNDSLDNRLPFRVDADSLKSGILRLHASYVFKEGGFLDSAQLRMLACYSDSTIDTVSYLIHKSFKKVNGNIAHMVPVNKYLISLEGFLFDHDTTKTSLVDIDDVKLTYIPTIGGDEMMRK